MYRIKCTHPVLISRKSVRVRYVHARGVVARGATGAGAGDVEEAGRCRRVCG